MIARPPYNLRFIATNHSGLGSLHTSVGRAWSWGDIPSILQAPRNNSHGHMGFGDLDIGEASLMVFMNVPLAQHFAHVAPAVVKAALSDLIGSGVCIGHDRTNGDTTVGFAAVEPDSPRPLREIVVDHDLAHSVWDKVQAIAEADIVEEMGRFDVADDVEEGTDDPFSDEPDTDS